VAGDGSLEVLLTPLREQSQNEESHPLPCSLYAAAPDIPIERLGLAEACHRLGRYTRTYDVSLFAMPDTEALVFVCCVARRSL